MSKLTWCVLMVVVVLVMSCAAPPAQEEGPAGDAETSAPAPAAEEPVVEEGFESGETGALEPGDASTVPDPNEGD